MTDNQNKGNAVVKKKKIRMTVTERREKQLISTVKPFEDFVASKGLTYREVAAAVGLSVTGVTKWLMVDDMSLVNLHAVAEAFHYTLEVELKDKEVVIDNVVVIDDNTGQKKLRFVEQALYRKKITKRELAKRLGKSYPAISRWFLVDNLMLSELNNIAEVLDMNLNYTFRPKPKQQQ